MAGSCDPWDGGSRRDGDALSAYELERLLGRAFHLEAEFDRLADALE